LGGQPDAAGVAVVRVAGVVAAVILCVLGRSSLGRALPDNRRLLLRLVYVPRVGWVV